MNERRAIVTLCLGEQAERIYQLGRPFRSHYAQLCSAEVITHRRLPVGWPGLSPFTVMMLAKLELMREAFVRGFSRVLWLDVDTLIRPDCPNLFHLVPRSHWAGFDECAVAWERPGWLEHVDAVHRSMVRVCQEDGLPVPDSQGRYFNCGVQLAGRNHQFLYQPAINPASHDWAEQSRINVRLFLSPQTPIFHLPDALNCMAWYWRRNYLENNWIIHYCGLAGQAQREAAMRRDVAIWSERYAHLLEKT